MSNPLMDWERQTELSLAMVALLRADGPAAIARAQRWTDGWVGRSITFSACMLMHEPARAMDVYGSVAQFEAMASAPTVEAHFGRGLATMFMRKAPEALAAFKAAATQAPSDPFVAFCLVALTTGPSWPAAEQAEAAARFAAHADHPLHRAAAILFRTV